jgi:YVTN family beta-propeller protein
MKKLFLFFVIIVSAVYLIGCSEEDVINTPVTSTKGVIVLYEGLFNQPSSYDYAFINTDSNTVYSNVYQNSNSGAHLNAVPDGLVLSTNLFVIAQGNFGHQGTIYKINSSTNQLISSRDFGNNPYSMALGSNAIYVTNTASDFISIMDMNFNPIADSISVGPNPSDIVIGSGYLFIAKQSYTFENSLAVINESSHQVNKLFLIAPPVSVDIVENWVCVSSYWHKMIYRLYGNNGQLIDSIPVAVTEPAIGSVCHGDSRTLFILGVSDTAFGGNIGKSVYKLDLISKALDPNFHIQFSGNDDVYGIAYNNSEKRLYISNSKGGLSNGELKIYDDNGSLVRTYNDVGGKFPKRMVFKY